MSSTMHPSDLSLSTFARIPAPARDTVAHWQSILAPVISLDTGIVAALRDLAVRTGYPYSTVRAKYYALKKGGANVLIDRRRVSSENKRDILSPQDIEILRRYVESNQRKSLPAIRKMRRDWKRGQIASSTAIDPITGYPRGWSPRNLHRFIPDRHTLAVARVGRSAAAGERRLVYTSRSNLWVGSHYLFDDMWHDHFVNVIDQAKSGRPLEFHALDLYSACRFAYGMSVRLENDGRMESLKESDMRYLLASILWNIGYSPRGTILVVEHGTAAIKKELEEMLYEETNGLVTVARSGMEGAAAAAHQYAGRSKGNFHFKAALESLGNLIHNEMGCLPAQTGMDVNRRPEQLHGLLKRNDALLKAISQLSPERVEMLRWPMLTIQQFRVIAEEIYVRINNRTEHDLEGWDQNYIPDARTGSMRRLSPAEVWSRGKRDLIRMRPEAIAGILARDHGVELSVRSGLLQIKNSEITGDIMRFDASMLPDREKYFCVLNPYAPESLWVYDASMRFIAHCSRVQSICRSDVEALQRECGRAAKIEKEHLAPFIVRHAQEARQRAADARHNARILSGGNPTSRIPTDTEALKAATQTHFLEDETSDADQLADALRELI